MEIIFIFMSKFTGYSLGHNDMNFVNVFKLSIYGLVFSLYYNGITYVGLEFTFLLNICSCSCYLYMYMLFNVFSHSFDFSKFTTDFHRIFSFMVCFNSVVAASVSAMFSLVLFFCNFQLWNFSIGTVFNVVILVIYLLFLYVNFFELSSLLSLVYFSWMGCCINCSFLVSENFWLIFIGVMFSLSLVSNSVVAGIEFLISHNLLNSLLGLDNNMSALDFISSSLERIFIFFFLTFVMFFNVSFPALTMFVANFINVFLFGLYAVSIFWFYQFWTVGLLVLSLFYYLFLTSNEFFLFLLSLLEMFSTVFQSITLSNRLTINIFAGSLLITLITLLLNATLLSNSFITTFFIGIFFLGFYSFEIFVLFIQLNIFVILYEVYSIYSNSINLESSVDNS